ncbi:MAG: hypothetical protein AB9834_15640 [Lentimicrobium sp.]
MRTGIYIALLFFTMISAANAQKPLTITDDSVKFGNTLCPGIWIDIPETKLETVRSSWIKYIEKGTKSKAIVTGNEITLFGALLSDISEAPVNIFSAAEGKDSLVRLFAALELKRDEFTMINSKEHEQLKKAVKQFAKDQYVKVAEDQLSVQESKLKDLEKELSSVRKEKEKLEKEIQSANTSISEEKYKIQTVQKELNVTEAALDAKSTELSTMADGDAKKALQSEVKDLQKKKKENMKDISSSENKISKANTLIKDNNSAIEANLKQQDEFGKKVSDQKLEVKKYSEKLKTIESY